VVASVAAVRGLAHGWLLGNHGWRLLAGHGGAVNSVAWSRDASMLVSASADRTVRVWSPLKSTAEALLVIDRRGAGGGAAVGAAGPVTPAGGLGAKLASGGGGGGGGGGKRADDVMLADEVKSAQFFYMDRFLCAVVGGRMILYELKLASEAGDDLERLRKRHRFREGCPRPAASPDRALPHAHLTGIAGMRPAAPWRACGGMAS
jgi:hypothetical protein